MLTVFTMFLVIIIKLLLTVRNVNTQIYENEELANTFEFDIKRIPEYYAKYVRVFAPRYENDAEREDGYEQFVINIERVTDMNKRVTNFKYGINEFSHLSLQQFTDLYTGFNDTGLTDTGAIHFSEKNVYIRLPPSFTLANYRIGIHVRKQIRCKSSFALAAIGSVDVQCALTVFHSLKFSEAQAFECEATGCCKYGGMPHLVLEALMEQGGVVLNQYYPEKFFTIDYDEKFCKVDPRTYILKITGVYRLKIPDEDVLLTAFLSYGSLVTAIYVSESVKSYKGGVLDPDDCNQKPNHNVLLIGFGVIAGTDIKYWHLLNSWGYEWGELGYFRLRRGQKACNIGSYVVATSVDTFVKHNVSTVAPLIPPNLPDPEKRDFHFGEKSPQFLRTNEELSNSAVTLKGATVIPLRQIDSNLKINLSTTTPISVLKTTNINSQ